MSKKATAEVIHISEPTNGGKETISHSEPFVVSVCLQGVTDILFHRWNCEAIEEKAKAAKNSKGKKSDDVESYVYRNDKDDICIPGEYLRGAIIHAAKFRQDPRSPRKSAMDLFKAGIIVMTPLASLGTKKWDYLHKSRVTIQRQGVNRIRPAMKVGWQVTFEIMSVLPEYIDSNTLRETIEAAGRLIGLADYRPTYGRFGIVNFKVL